MPTWLIGALRAGLQIAWTWLIAKAAERGLTLPADAPAWLDEVLLGIGLAAFVGVVQWLETRGDSSVFGRLARQLASVLMLGARKADYPKPTPESAKLLGAR